MTSSAGLVAELTALVEQQLAAIPDRMTAGRYQPSNKPLSRAEQAVLGQLLQGLGNKEIAYRLGSSEATIKVQMGSITKKFGAKNRTHLALLAVGALSA